MNPCTLVTQQKQGWVCGPRGLVFLPHRNLGSAVPISKHWLIDIHAIL